MQGLVTYGSRGWKSLQENHLNSLSEFVEAQSRFYSDCHRITEDLRCELAAMVGAGGETTTTVAVQSPD